MKIPVNHRFQIKLKDILLLTVLLLLFQGPSYRVLSLVERHIGQDKAGKHSMIVLLFVGASSAITSLLTLPFTGSGGGGGWWHLASDRSAFVQPGSNRIIHSNPSAEIDGMMCLP